MRHRPKNPPVIGRRRPQQTRARQTAGALQEALVRILLTRGYDTVTIRDITDVAGTAIGSFYEYFANKDELAMVCVHLRSKSLLRALQGMDCPPASMPLEKMVRLAIRRLLAAHGENPSHWGVHYLLERRFSGVQPYAKMYDKFVDAWQRLLNNSSNRHCPNPADAARVCQTIIYGLFAHAHLRGLSIPGMRVDHHGLYRQSRQALLGYLMRVTVPAPHR